MATTLTSAAGWQKYSWYYKEGFACQIKRDLPVYKQEKGNETLTLLKKGHEITTTPILTGQPSRVHITFAENMQSLEGFVSLGQLGAKPGQILKQNLKPQDFAMPLDKKVTFHNYYNGVMSALGEREDVPLVIRAYLKALVKYCYEHKDHKNLQKTYKNLMDTKYAGVISEIESDFSEIMAPLCVLERGQGELTKMGFKGLTKEKTMIYVPKKGNEPLMDFALYGKDGREYKFSVKKATGVTNTVKPKDIIELMKDLTKVYEGEDNYEILKVLAENSIKLGPLYAFKAAYKRFPQVQMKLKQAGLDWNIDMMIPEGRMPDVELYQAQWTKVMSLYYNEGIDYWNDDTFTDGKLGVVSLTCQTALEKMTKGEKLWNYRDIIVDVVMKQVSFYKFKLNKGDPQFFMSNDLYNKIPNNAQFYLRNKSSKSRPYRETVGVQP
tara:strand:+ start:10957 stop:12270 length:1314 start_codon:yes stop_codon:yes gene_type:complete